MVINFLLCLIYELNFVVGIVFFMRNNIIFIIGFVIGCGFWYFGVCEGRIFRGWG